MSDEQEKDIPILVIVNDLELNKRTGTYKIKFYEKHLAIEDDDRNEVQAIQYKRIKRITSAAQQIRITTREAPDLILTCTSHELRKLRELFYSNAPFVSEKINGVAFVEFGDACFFIKISSTCFKEFKKACIKRVAKYFYPAINQQEITMNLFEKFAFKIKKDNQLAPIDSNDDLEAMLTYFNYKIDVNIELHND